MQQIILSHKKATTISNGVFLISVGILIFTGAWWPGIILALWATMASRQYLQGHVYQAFLTSGIFGGLFVLTLIKFNYDILAPVLFVIGGLFLIVREYFFSGDTNGEEKSEELKEDIDIDE